MNCLSYSTGKALQACNIFQYLDYKMLEVMVNPASTASLRTLYASTLLINFDEYHVCVHFKA